ncbi:Peroxiredoxin [Actinacidiphila guanduensis]|uniref:thioredoxin-dependent peroxiredoxin n=2 Tax=Actinacidiphila guanduensis TaxID=310781 RepID=A0A1H0BE53_9ACTN|nr:Peroxiredoxin [Actinacidiphila guanduensis]
MGGGDPADPFSQERAGLRAAAAPVTAVPGTDLPDPPMLDAGGTATSVSAARAGRPAVVVLYRGAWCPFCNVALRVYREQLQPELLARGIALIAVSPQHPDGSLTMREKHDLDFAVLSDPGNRLAISLGVLTAPSPEAREAQLALGLDLEAVNADGTTGLPMPTTAIVDGAGRLVWIDVHPDYATRTEPHQVLDALDGLGIQGGVRG